MSYAHADFICHRGFVHQNQLTMFYERDFRLQHGSAMVKPSPTYTKVCASQSIL